MIARVVYVLILLATPARAWTVHGLVFDDANGDGHPNAGERGVPAAVVAYGIRHFVTTDARGQFVIEVPDDELAVVWVRVPDGFEPRPTWAWPRGPTGEPVDVELALHRLASPPGGPVTFVVAADLHMTIAQPFWAELAGAASAAIALDPPPAFFTILGDITSGNQDEQFDLVDHQLEGLGVPYVPVPGNHDWYDDGETWRRRYGPDNYSFDIGRVHFVVWNMMMPAADIDAYLGAELARVAPDTTVVALTHAPPVPEIVDVLHRLGVDYVLTGHTHTNRVVDHDGIVELTTEPLLMGGLDLTPAGYRVVTIEGGRLSSYHRTTIAPRASVIAPAPGRCVSPTPGATAIAAVELDGGAAVVSARVDCATPIELGYAGGWAWRGALPGLAPGPHQIAVEARSTAGVRAVARATFEVCEAPALAPTAPAAWPQLGGSPSHTGATARVIAPPLAARWTTPVGGHVLHASPVAAGALVFVAATDLGDGNAGGVVAIDLATGAVRWRVATPVPVRGGVAVIGNIVVAPLFDGTLLGLDAQAGAERWRYELGAGIAPEAASVWAQPAIDDGDVLAGNRRHLAVLDGATGSVRWSVDPVPDATYSQSLASVAVGDGVVVGVFHRELGGVIAWDRLDGHVLWRREGEQATAINATPVITDGVVYVVNGLTEVIALDLATGAERWQTKLDPAGFDWGNATAGAPAFADGVLVVPTLYRDVVALDATTGAELWRFAGTPSTLRTTHYRGTGEAGFEAAPVITGDIVWVADTAGRLTALALRTGAKLWHQDLGAPVLAGLAVAGDWLVIASYDGTIRAFGPPDPAAGTPPDPADLVVPRAGCCQGTTDAPLALALIVFAALRRRRRCAIERVSSAPRHRRLRSFHRCILGRSVDPTMCTHPRQDPEVV